MSADRTVNDLTREAVDLLRKHRDADGETPGLLRQVADLFVDLRQLFITPSGEPDWTGSTKAYKMAVRGIFSDAGYQGQRRATVQASIRYHVNNVLRERLTPEELDYLGLHRESARQRHSVQRTTQAEMFAAMRPTSEPVPDRVVDPMWALTGAAGLLQHVTSEQVAALEPMARRTARRQVSLVTTELGRITTALADADDV